MDSFDPRTTEILNRCEPYLVTFRGNLDRLDLAPFGQRIAAERRYDPTRLSSRRVIDGLHHLDAFSFGGQEMLMPRWVLFDCGEFPGIVFGFGQPARRCPDDVRAAYRVTDSADDDVFVPLSMWVAIRCAEDDAWFGHNLSSANLVAKSAPLPGLATVTKALGIKVARARKQYGATQWSSASLNIHLSLGEMRVLNAYTPAHTHLHTFSYCIEVDDERLQGPLRPGFTHRTAGGERSVLCDDEAALKRLQKDLEGGAVLYLHRVERPANAPQVLWLSERPGG